MKTVLSVLLLAGLLNCHAAIQFDGIDDQVVFPDIDALDSQSAISVVFWMNMEAATSSFGYVVSKHDSAAQIGWGIIRNGAANDLFLFVRNGSATPSSTSNGGNVPTNQWLHIAFLYDGNGVTEALKVRLQVNGVGIALTPTGTAPATTGTSSTNVIVGKNPNLDTLYFKGSMTDMVICNRVLNQPELDRHRLSKVRYAIRSPVAYYPMDNIPDGQSCNGLIVSDRSGNNNNGVGNWGAGAAGLNSRAEIRIVYP